MKYFSFFPLLFCLFHIGHAQIPVGYKYDLNGMPLDGYYDPFSYNPLNAVRIVHHSDSYEKGHYYDYQGQKIEGLIKYENKKILFKENDEVFRDKIRPDSVKAVVIGTDSFFVAKNFYFKNKLRKDPEFVQFIAQTKDAIYAKHYHFNQVVTYGTPPIVETFIVKPAGEETWQSLTGNPPQFNVKINEHFSEVPNVMRKLAEGTLDEDDALSLIRGAEYYDKYKSGKPIYFNKYWQPVLEKSESVFEGKIKSVEDTIWNITYYREGRKLFEVGYSWFSPDNKNGMFRAFDNEGVLWKEVEYQNDRPQRVAVFDKNGVVHYSYHFDYVEDPYGNDEEVSIIYDVLNDPDGTNLAVKKNFTADRYDPWDDRNYTMDFEQGKVLSTYYEKDGQKVYHITEPGYDFKTKGLQNKANYYLDFEEYEDALSENAEGMILVSFLINEKGYCIDHETLTQLHTELDFAMERMIVRGILEEAELSLRFKPYKHNKEKVLYEVIVPFEFRINRFYRATNYNYFFMHHMMFQQQMMMRSVPITPPPSFGGF